jgi:hypothetical protein
VLSIEVYRPAITVQREFRARFKKDALYKNSVTRWYLKFVETGCLCKGRRPGRPPVCDDTIERVREAFKQSPRKSVARASITFRTVIFGIRNSLLALATESRALS